MAHVIRSDAELEETRSQLDEQEARLLSYRRELEADGLPAADVEQALAPLRLFADQLRESVREYERVRRGRLPPIGSLEELGGALVALRLATGLTQRELASRLAVHESQISRDEKTNYQGVTIERASRVLEALGAKLEVTLVLSTRPQSDRKED